MLVISVQETDITREMCLGAHIPRGNTYRYYHCTTCMLGKGYFNKRFLKDLEIELISTKSAYLKRRDLLRWTNGFQHSSSGLEGQYHVSDFLDAI